MQLLEEELQIQEDPEVPVKLARLINKIYEATYQATFEPDIKLNENEKPNKRMNGAPTVKGYTY